MSGSGRTSLSGRRSGGKSPTGRRVVGLLAAVAGGALLVFVAYQGLVLPRQQLAALNATPETLALPESLEDLASQFPRIADLLREPELDRIYKDLLLAYERDSLRGVEDLARRRGLLNEADDIRMTLVVDVATNTPSVADALRAQDVKVDVIQGTDINIGISMDRVREAAGRDKRIDEIFVDLTALDHVVRLKLPPTMRPYRQALREGEGVDHVGADAWHSGGHLGQGIKIGVLDLGFDGYDDLLGDELPDNVMYEFFGTAGPMAPTDEVHGTACAEIVHEMAPEADLFLAGYDGTIAAQAKAVAWLQDQGVQIISHSAGSSLDPMDGTGPQAQLVDNVADNGILWVNAAGNEAESHYQAEFTDRNGNGWHEFPDGEETMAVKTAEDSRVSMRWDDWQAVDQDLDLVLFDDTGGITDQSGNIQSGQPGQEPIEFIDRHASGIAYVGIRAANITHPPMMHVFMDGGRMGWLVREQSLGAPADAEGAVAVAAVEVSNDTVAEYSSFGPTSDGRLKPDIGAPTNVRSKSYDRFGQRFEGTSAAAPHVAGAAALVWSDHPEYGPEDVRGYLSKNAKDLLPTGRDTVSGAGLLRLPAPMSAPPGVTPPTIQPDVTVSPPVVTPPTIPPDGTPPTAVTGVTEGPTDATTTPSPTATSTRIATANPTPTEQEDDPAPQPDLTDLGLGFLGGVLAIGGLVYVLQSRNGSGDYRPPPPPPPGPKPGPVKVEPTLVAVGTLVVGQGPNFLVGEGRSVLGRDPALCAMVLADPQVSRRHVEFYGEVDHVWITDLDSLGGTFVNGHRMVGRYLLRHGDRLRVGQTDMVWDQAGGPMPGPMPQGMATIHYAGGTLPVSADGVIIGRDPSCDLVLDDPEASRQHARISLSGGQWQIQDLRSRNGTFVEDRRVPSYSLRGGERIRIGQTELTFHRPPATHR